MIAILHNFVNRCSRLEQVHTFTSEYLFFFKKKKTKRAQISLWEDAFPTNKFLHSVEYIIPSFLHLSG